MQVKELEGLAAFYGWKRVSVTKYGVTLSRRSKHKIDKLFIPWFGLMFVEQTEVVKILKTGKARYGITLNGTYIFSDQ